MKLGKKEIEKVLSTSKAQSIVSSRMSSRATSKKGSRSGSMDGIEEFKKAEELKPKTKDGRIINKLNTGDVIDSNQMEQVPDPFAAEQTYLTEDDIKNA